MSVLLLTKTGELKVVVVMHNKTKKLIPFQYRDNGEVEILSTDPNLNVDDLIVSMVEPFFIDWENGYYLEYKAKGM